MSSTFEYHLQKRAMDAEQEAAKAYRQIDKLKKKHVKEIVSLNPVILLIILQMMACLQNWQNHPGSLVMTDAIYKSSFFGSLVC